MTKADGTRDEAAAARMKKIPAFVRGMVVSAVEESCRKSGLEQVTVEELDRLGSLEHLPQAAPARGARVTDLNRVIHEPARLLLVALLAGVKEADFLWLLRESGLTKGNLSSHLARLEEAGYVDVQKTFKGKIPLTVLRLTRAGKSAFDVYKKKMNGLLALDQ